MSPESIARYEWLMSQAEWHGHRSLKAGWPTVLWHRRQRKWYQAQIHRIPGVMTWIIQTAMEAARPALLDNITRNNALLTRLMRHGNGG